MLKNVPEYVKVVEVGPRDGLQNEKQMVAFSDKVRLIESLAQSGLKHIEVTSFVSPKWIPQLSDGLEVAQAIKIPSDVQTLALVPNLIGYERAKKANLPEICLFMSATEAHSRKNINKSIAEALTTLAEVAELAKKDGKRIRCYLSVVFECPYEGPVAVKSIVDICEKLISFGVDEIALSDTIGAATPRLVLNVVKNVTEKVNLNKLALHLHDTRGMALVNVLAGLEAGITTFDGSVGGMGGCPYAPGASGNLATEDLVYLLNSFGIATGVNLERLIACGRLAQTILGKQLPGRYLQSVLGKEKGSSRTGLGNYE